jgi:cellobiose-specific phosphotransferase system component IIC
MKNLILKYGLLSGAASVVLMTATTLWFRQSGKLEGGEWFGYGGMILSMVIVFIGVRVFRDQQRNGVISFGEAFKVAGLMCLISCTCYVVGWMLIYHFVMPDFMEQYFTAYMDKMKASGTSEMELQKASEQMMHYKELYKNPLYRAGLTFMEPLPVALLISVLSAAILRRKA